MNLNYNTNITKEEQSRRISMVTAARSMMLKELSVEADENALVMPYEDFYLQISFSQLHPLMMLHFARPVSRQMLKRDYEHVNKLNTKSVLGGHSLDPGMGCYLFRTTQWLDKEITRDRFFEVLLRSYDEAARGYSELFGEKVM